MFLGTGDERIELPPKVLETPIIPFDQSPMWNIVYIMYNNTNWGCLSMVLKVFTIADGIE